MYIRLLQLLCDGHAFLHRRAGDIRQDHCILLHQIGQLLLDEGIDTRILQANGIQHAPCGFRNPGCIVAVALCDGGSLCSDTAKLRQGEQLLVFMAITEYTGGGDNGVLEGYPCYIYRQISHSKPPPLH